MNSVILLCHKRTFHLERVIDSLKRAEGIEQWNVVFILQNATEEVYEVIETKKLGTWKIIVNNYLDGSRTIRGAINGNIFKGLREAFVELRSEICLVLEDDVVIGEAFLQFILRSFDEYSSNKYFRGVVGCSLYSAEKNSGHFIRANFGISPGWAIGKDSYARLLTFWNGQEELHWDYYLEPFFRTGFFVWPLYSQVLNIGYDESGTHAKSNEWFTELNEASFAKRLVKVSHKLAEAKNTSFIWREDFINLSDKTKWQRAKIYIQFFVAFRIYEISIRIQKVGHFYSRRIREHIVKNI